MILKKTLEEKILPLVEKPGRYIGNELNSIHKDLDKASIKIVLAYPDLYEVGMSNLGIQILYCLLNSQKDIACERVFAPALDFEHQLTTNNLQLTTLESMIPLKEFDMIGFSLQHELTYTNLLNILNLAGVPLRSAERFEHVEQFPLIFAGGPCAYNPGPLADFIDFFVIGEGEEVILEILDLIRNSCLPSGTAKFVIRYSLLESLSQIEGVYVPSFPKSKIKKRIVKDFNKSFYPTKPIVPFIEIIHDRSALEIMRGCPRSCKFCQAGKTSKPVRLKTPQKLKSLAFEILKNTGYEEISLVSLSSCDYPGIKKLAHELSEELKGRKISISLPSSRPDAFSVAVSSAVSKVRKTGITLAPEAGTQRLRDFIGKDVTEEEILKAARAAFEGGGNSIKLYFMTGLPTEKEEDLRGIIDLSRKILEIGKNINKKARLTVSLSTFIPKPHTPFERECQITIEETYARQKFIKEHLKDRSIEVRWHQPEMSFLEGVFSRGDQKLSKVLEIAFEKGIRLDSWGEYFKFNAWKSAFNEVGIDPNSYLSKREPTEALSWSIIDAKN